MKLGVVGSRTWTDSQHMISELDALKPSCIVSGGASGADRLAAAYAHARGLLLIEFLPDWKRDGRSAGFKRNALIVETADKVIAFWNGNSRGTQHSISLAKRAGKLLKIVYAAEAGGGG